MSFSLLGLSAIKELHLLAQIDHSLNHRLLTAQLLTSILKYLLWPWNIQNRF